MSMNSWAVCASWMEPGPNSSGCPQRVRNGMSVVYGNTAVVVSRYRQTAKLGNRDASGELRITDVWVRRDGRWQIVRRHATSER